MSAFDLTDDEHAEDEARYWHSRSEHELGPVFDAAQLMRADLAPPSFAVPGIVPEGLNIFAGKPKLGKSWGALGIGLGVACGGTALGVQVDVGDVLYLAMEDTPRRLQDRLRMMLDGAPPPARLEMACRWPRLDDTRCLERLTRWQSLRPAPKLLVVDTFAKLRGRSRANVGMYESDYGALDGLKRFADDHHLTVLVVHHTRKGAADDPLDEVSGSTGLTGAADGVLVLKRDRGRMDAVLHVTGRDVEEAELALNFDATRGQWTLVGTADEYRVSLDHARIRDTLGDSDDPMSPKQVADAAGLNHEMVKKYLLRASKDGSVRAVGGGKYGLPSNVVPLVPVSLRDRGTPGTGAPDA